MQNLSNFFEAGYRALVSVLMEITLVQGVTLAIAVLGAVLGVINTWHALDKNRVKLRVTPQRSIPIGATNPRLTFSIEIVNLSAFAVTVNDVGVLYKGTDARGSIAIPVLFDGGQWPRRLEPRSSVTVHSERPASQPGARIKCAYARTQCGHMQKGTSPALKLIAAGRGME